jgi:hypothetical protein
VLRCHAIVIRIDEVIYFLLIHLIEPITINSSLCRWCWQF